jgi:hypothetical protein
MPAFRIVYVSDHVGRVETATATFAGRDEALAAFSTAGLRVLHIGEMRAGERAADPVVVPMAAAAQAAPLEAGVRGLAFGTAR